MKPLESLKKAFSAKNSVLHTRGIIRIHPQTEEEASEFNSSAIKDLAEWSKNNNCSMFTHLTDSEPGLRIEARQGRNGMYYLVDYWHLP